MARIQVDVYKGLEIYLEKSTGKFIVDDGLEGQFDTLAEVQKAIRKVKASGSSAKKIDVIYIMSRWHDDEKKIIAATSTGAVDQWGSVWVTDKADRDRSKMPGNYVYLDTPRNRRHLNEVLRLKAQIAEIEEQVDVILRKKAITIRDDAEDIATKEANNE